MNGTSDASLIIFALLAVFVIWKLRSVLGTRTGHERPPHDPFQASPVEPDAVQRSVFARKSGAPVLAPAVLDENRWKKFAAPGSPTWNGLDAIARADSSFDPEKFVSGASAAYEMIITAFAKGDRETLKGLLSPEVLESFTAALAESDARGETRETTIVSLSPSSIDDAHAKGDFFYITARFQSKLISVTRDKNGAIIDGDPNAVADHTDIWTFAKPAASRNPNWTLVATSD